MSREHPHSNLSIDLNSGTHGADNRSSGTIHSGCPESQIQSSSRKDVHISSGTTLSSDTLTVNLCSNLTDSAESRSHEELSVQASVQEGTTIQSNQGTEDWTPHKDIDCERIDGTTVCEGRDGVELLFQISAQRSNQLPTPNRANEELESSSLKEIPLQMPNIKTGSFRTDDCRSEMDISCVGSDINTSGEVSYDLSKTNVNKRDDGNHSINMTGEDIDGTSHDDSSDGDIGEESLFESTASASQESQIQCFPEKKVNSSSDEGVSHGKQHASFEDISGANGGEDDRQMVFREPQKLTTKLPVIHLIRGKLQEQIPSTSTSRSSQNRERGYLSSVRGKNSLHSKQNTSKMEYGPKTKLIGCEKTPIYRKHYKCAVCEKTFSRRVGFLCHRKSHRGLLETHRCQSCSKLFKQKAALHSEKETGDDPLICQLCKKTAVKIFETMSKRSSTSAKVFRCQVCQKAFSSKFYLNRHNNIHTGRNLFQCHFCGKLFPQSANLMMHERIHSNNKPFKCQFCTKRFAQKGNMVFHEKRHTGEKPFKCKFCAKTFVRKGNVAPHERIHTGDRPYKCRFCRNDFVQKSHLVEHERSHTGERPFKCQFCEKTFIRKGHAAHHERYHTGEKPYKCGLCGKGFLKQKDVVHHESNYHCFQ